MPPSMTKDILNIINTYAYLQNIDEVFPYFCFGTEIIEKTGFDISEEEIAKIAIENNYTAYKVFPQETMRGGLIICAPGCDKTIIEQAYEDFYGEIPDILPWGTLEETAGGLAHGMSIEDIANKHNVSIEQIEGQLEVGIDIELEHTSDYKVAEKIAMDHLVEFPDYYDRLTQMEQEAEAADPLDEAKKKKKKRIKVGDPNAKAMWGRTRHKIETPKKGKGSYTRKKRTKKDEALVLNEGTSNFALMKNLPLLVFSYFEDAYQSAEEDASDALRAELGDEEYEELSYESQLELLSNKTEELLNEIDYCLLVDEQVDELNADIDEFNNTFESELDFGTDEPISIRPGYYEAAQLYCSSSEYLNEEEHRAVLEFFYLMKDKYYLTEYSMAYRDSTGATGYNKISDGQGIEPTILLKGDEAASQDDLDEDFKGEFVPAPLEVVEAFKKLLEDSGYTVNSIQPYESLVTKITNYHFQITSIKPNFTKQNFGEEFDRMADIIDDFDNTHNVSITYSFSLTNNGYSTAGLDIREQWVDPSDMVSLDTGEKVSNVPSIKPRSTKVRTRVPFKEEVTGAPSKDDLKRITKKHKKTDKKGARGWFINLNAGNVEANINRFNHVAGAGTEASASTVGTAPAGLGESVEEENAVEPYFVFEDRKNDILILIDATSDTAMGKNTWGEIQMDYFGFIRALNKSSEDFFDYIATNGSSVVNSYSTARPHARRIKELQKKLNYIGWIDIGIDDPVLHAEGLVTLLSDESSIELHNESIDKANKAKGQIYKEFPQSEIINNKGLDEEIIKHEELNPKLWENNELKPEVKAKILEIVDSFIKGLEDDKIKINITDIILVGSNCSYNYHDRSDLDVHIKCETSSLTCPDNLYPLLYSAYRSIFNKKYDIEFYGINVELYVETEDTPLHSNGIYSLNTGWIKEPVKEDIPDVDMEKFEQEFSKWEDTYFDLIADEEIPDEKPIQDITEEIKVSQRSKTDEIDDFIEDIYDLRKAAIAADGEYSIGNLIFKEFRSLGYLDALKNLKIKLKSKELSLEGLVESDEESKLDRYAYEGPIKRFGKTVKADAYIVTTASSLDQAIRNLRFKAAQEIGFNMANGAKVDIEVENVYLIKKQEPEPIKPCEKCGATLTDAGECPNCVLGDPTALDEAIDTAVYFTHEHLAKLANSVKEDGTYTLDTNGNLSRVDLKSGWQVSFFRPEITNTEIKLILSVIKDNLGEPYLGLFNGTGEISYNLQAHEDAAPLAEIFNQESIWDNARQKEEKTPAFNPQQKVDYSEAAKKLVRFFKNRG